MVLFPLDLGTGGGQACRHAGGPGMVVKWTTAALRTCMEMMTMAGLDGTAAGCL
jgi:hypothetical protein